MELYQVKVLQISFQIDIGEDTYITMTQCKSIFLTHSLMTSIYGYSQP